MYYPEELIEEVRQKKYRGCAVRLCEASEKGKFLFWTMSIS